MPKPGFDSALRYLASTRLLDVRARPERPTHASPVRRAGFQTQIPRSPERARHTVRIALTRTYRLQSRGLRWLTGMAHSRMRNFLLAVLLTVSPSLLSADLPLIFSEDFSDGADDWTPTDARAWKITTIGDNKVYENVGGSEYRAPYRSPYNISLLNDHTVGDFVLTARVQSKQEPRDHRDMCLFFGYQDDSNFYYVHLGQKTDPHANQIFLVNEAPRIAISEKTSDGTPWESDTWHEVKIVRKVDSGRIEIYFDDMENPTHIAHDKTFVWGRIGIGTFDDMGLWDDIKLQGNLVNPPSLSQANPKQLFVEKWTPDFEVPDPVAISFDPQGRAYVTQTQRRKANDLDIRQNMDWLEDDLRFTSTQDKEEFYREQFTPENSDASAHRVEDYNGDGIHDIKDLTALTERIHLIVDEDEIGTPGRGEADSISVFAEDLNHLIGGVAGGVLYHDGAVYTCPVPELVRFRDTDGDGKADEKKVLVSGFGVHLAYAGHDMHGLTVGPDGKLYWSVGDKGIRVKTDDGRDYKFPNQGGLMRCDPDGSNFEIYAHGQRNIQEVAFDQYGNFFGVDNDADFSGENERFVYIEQYMDSGWRANWQYLRDDYNPWNDDLMHKPWHEEQPRWFTPPISNYENGPAGFKFNPGNALSTSYHNYFFLTSAPRGEQWAFKIRPAGDSFEMFNDHKIAEGIPLVGLNFGPDGSLYGVDWGGGYPLNQKGSVWRFNPHDKESALMLKDVEPLIRADFSSEELAALTAWLGHPDQRIRLKAQFEIVKREKASILIDVAKEVSANQLARVHSIWGIAQLIRSGIADDSDLTALFGDPDPEIRAQAVRHVTDRYGIRLGLDRIAAPTGEPHPLTESLTPLLSDPSQRVRMQALLGIGRLGDTAAETAIVELLGKKEHAHSLAYLRHAGVIALAGAVSSPTLESMKDHKSDFLRGCAVIALRKRDDPAIATFLDDKDHVTAVDAAHGIHDDWMIPEAMPQLAAALGKHVSHEPFTRRAINANLRIGDSAAADRVATFVAAGKGGQANLDAGLEALENWTTPPNLDLVVGRYRPIEPRDPDILTNAIAKHIDQLLLSDFSSVRSTSMKLARSSGIKIDNETLLTVFGNSEAAGTLRAEALRTLAMQKSDQLTKTVAAGLGDSSDTVQIASLDILSESQPEKAVLAIEDLLQNDAGTPVKQHAIRQLPKLGNLTLLSSLVDQLTDNSLSPELHLDIFEAALESENEIKATAEKLTADWNAKAPSDPLAPYLLTLEGGDVERGKSVFMNHPAGQCVRCHKVQDGKGSNVGPNLKWIGSKKDRRYILEGLVNPQAVIAKGYGNISLTLTDGTSLAGQFRGESDGNVILRDIENKETKVAVNKIAERSPVVSTMPPMGFILTKSELRDVIAYLASLREKEN